MAIELFQPTNLRSITANSSGATQGYRMTLSGATNGNVAGAGAPATGTAVSGPITSAFHLVGIVIKWDVAVNTGVTVRLIGRPGTTPIAFTGVSFASGTSALRTSWKWFPSHMYIPKTHTVQVWAGPNPTGTSAYIDAIVRF